MNPLDEIISWFREKPQLSEKAKKVIADNPEQFQRLYQQVVGKPYVQPLTGLQRFGYGQTPEQKAEAQRIQAEQFARRQTDFGAWIEKAKKYGAEWGEVSKQFAERPSWQGWLEQTVPPAALFTNPAVQKITSGIQTLLTEPIASRAVFGSTSESQTGAEEKYRKWEAPWGVKGALELAFDPTMYIPGGGVGKAGKLAKLTPSLERWAAKEFEKQGPKAAQRIFEVVTRHIPKEEAIKYVDDLVKRAKGVVEVAPQVAKAATGLTIAEIDTELLRIARAKGYQDVNKRGAARLAEMTQIENQLFAEKARLQGLAPEVAKGAEIPKAWPGGDVEIQKDIFGGEKVVRVAGKGEVQAPRLSDWQKTIQAGLAPKGRFPSGGVVGKTTTAFGVDPSKTYKFRYKVAELEDIVASHLDNLELNPKYPAELQRRIRSREMSRVQIDEIAQNLEPDALLYDTRRLDTGLMIVGADNIVESGNGRVLGLRKAVQDYPEKYTDYLTKLKQQAKELGFDTKKLEDMQTPVLVRERLTDVPNRAAFAAEANVPVTMAMSPYEQAVQDASNLSDEVFSRLTVGEEQTIKQTLKSPANRDVVYHFLQNIPETARAAISDAKGNMNMAGLQRMKIAFLAKTFSGPSGRRLAEVFIESANPMVKNIENAIFKALPKFTKAEAVSKTAFTEDLARAIEVFARLKSDGIKISDYIKQIGMWGEELTAIQKMILDHLDDIGNRSKVLREFFMDLSDAILKIPAEGQIAFGGVERLSKEGIINAVITRQRKGLKQEALNLATYTAKGAGLEKPIAGGAGQARTMEPPISGGPRGIAEAIPEAPVAARGEAIPQTVKGVPSPPPKYPWQELPGVTLTEAQAPLPGARPSVVVTKRPPGVSGLEGRPPLREPPPRPPSPPTGGTPAIPPLPQAASSNKWVDSAIKGIREYNRRITTPFAQLNEMFSRVAKATGGYAYQRVTKGEDRLVRFVVIKERYFEKLRQVKTQLLGMLENTPAKLEDIEHYWVMRHQLEIMIEHGRLLSPVWQGKQWTSHEIMNELAVLEKRLGDTGMKAVDDSAQKLSKVLTDEMMRSQELPKALKDHLANTYKYYCPSLYETEEIIKTLSNKLRLTPEIVKELRPEITGVKKVLKAPLETFAEMFTYRGRTNELSEIKGMIVDSAMKDPELKGLVELVDKMPKAGAFMDYFDNGVRKYMEIKPGAEWLDKSVRAIIDTPGDTLSLFNTIGKMANKPLKVGATAANIPFIVAQTASDYLSALMLKRIGPARELKGAYRAFKSVFTEDEIINAARLEGAFPKGFAGRTPETVFGRDKAGNYLVKDSRRLIHTLQDLAHATEIATRAAVYEKGGPFAALGARRTTVDWDIMGDLMRIGNSWVPFLNPGYQGLLLPFRAIRDNPRAVIANLTALVGAVTATYAWNKQFPAYERVNETQKLSQIFIMMPSDKFDNEGNPIPKRIILVPMMREFSIFTAPIIYLLRRLEGKGNKDIMAEFMTWFPSINPFSNIISGGTSAIGELIQEQISNHDNFRNQPIVPEYMEKLPPEQQVFSTTSVLAIEISRALQDTPLGLSPLRWDHLLNNAFAGLGQDVAKAISQVIRFADSKYNNSALESNLGTLRGINKSVPPDAIEGARGVFLDSLDPKMRQMVLQAERIPTDYIPIISSIIGKFYKNYASAAPPEVYIKDQEAKLGEKIGEDIFTTDTLAWKYDNTISNYGKGALVNTELGKFYLQSQDYIGKSFYKSMSAEKRLEARDKDALLEAHLLFWGDLKLDRNPRSMAKVKQWSAQYQIPRNGIPALQPGPSQTSITAPSMHPPKTTTPRSNVYIPGYRPRTQTAPTKRKLEELGIR